MNTQDLINDISQRIIRALSNSRMDEEYKLTLDVTVKIKGDKYPIELHETLENKRKNVSRQDDIEEIVKKRINRMIHNIAGRWSSGEYISVSDISVTDAYYKLE